MASAAARLGAKEQSAAHVCHLLSHHSFFRFNKEASARFPNFALAEEARWSANFRDLNAAMRRMATMAPTGRITLEVVEEEMARLRASWLSGHDQETAPDILREVLDDKQLAELDLFDIAQLQTVVRVCRQSSNLSEAGRKLLAASRQRRRVLNDADRLRKYLTKFDLGWEAVSASSKFFWS